MEILLEIAIVIAQFLGELLFQMLFELAAEIGIRSVKEVFRNSGPTNPVLAAIGYWILGIGAGWISLFLLSSSLLHHAVARAANLLMTPIAAGLIMALIGAWRRRKDQELIRLDRFSYGFLFAFGMALIRYIWTINT